MALLILGCAVVAGAGEGGLVDLREVEGQVGGEVGVLGVDAGVEDGDADTGAGGDVPGAVGGASGDAFAVASDLFDGPVLGIEGVEDVGLEGGLRRWSWLLMRERVRGSG